MRSKLAISMAAAAALLTSLPVVAVAADGPREAYCERPSLVRFYCYYPYASSYQGVDDGYDFPADRLWGQRWRPDRVAFRQAPRLRRGGLIRPRISFRAHVLRIADEL